MTTKRKIVLSNGNELGELTISQVQSHITRIQ